MAFMLFKKEFGDDGTHYVNAHQHYKLAGYNLLYKLWEKRSKPVQSGWSVTADDLLKEHGNGFSSDDFTLVIDFDPNSQQRIGLVEIESIHVFTYGDNNSVFWSPMMLELRDVYYEEFDEPLLPGKKSNILDRLPSLAPSRDKIVEFLYLQGAAWSWGRNGSTNAAFIKNDARKFFQSFFTLSANENTQ
jgi:hypothetical protein